MGSPPPLSSVGPSANHSTSLSLIVLEGFCVKENDNNSIYFVVVKIKREDLCETLRTVSGT